jgi:uncharacterized protein YgiM (DUF1202 family)
MKEDPSLADPASTFTLKTNTGGKSRMQFIRQSTHVWKFLKVRGLYALFALIVLSLSFGGASAQSDSGTAIRFLHVVPGLAEIDVYVDDTLVAGSLDYGIATTYINVPAGNHTVHVTLAGLTSVLWEQPLAVPEGEHLTLIASSTDPLNFTTFRDDLTPLPLGTSRIIVVHAISGGPNIDFLVEGDVIVSDLAYGNFINSIDVPANTYTMTAVPTGGAAEDAILPELPVSLVGGTTQILVLYGTPGGASALTLTTPTAAEGDTGLVRIAHGVSEGPAVNVLVNDALVVPNLVYGAATEHLALPVGDHTVSVQDTESGEEIASGDLSVAAGEAQTVIALAADEGVTVTSFPDEISSVDATTASLSVANLSAQPITVSFDDNPLIEDLGVGEVSETLNFEPLTLTISVEGVTAEPQTVTLYGGLYYNIPVLADGSVLLRPTVLSRSLESSPGADAVAPATPQPVEPGQATEEVAGTEEMSATDEVSATEEAVATEEMTATEEVATTAEATAAPTVPAVTPTATPVGPTARVLLNPGANLQLRQFPFSQAFSLGRAPADSVLIVLGREGAPAVEETVEGTPEVGAEPTPEATEFVDPVTLLASPEEDLVPEDTWLFVIYQTPDGGEIEAWVNALYVQIRDTRGFLLRLRDLPTIPGNREGVSRDTSILPPTVERQFVQGIVTDLNEGVNLNIRRTASDDSEVLAQLANGDTVTVVGLGSSGQWAFVRYQTPEGGEVTGWANLEYLDFQYNGQPITPGDAQTRDLFDPVDEGTDRGAVSASTTSTGSTPVATTAAAQPTAISQRNVVIATVGALNEGIRLNLRRTPSTAGEVIANIEPGTQLIVLSKDMTGEWLQTEFDGQLGWVSTQYVFLTFNGASATLDQVLVNTDLIAAATGLPTETATVVITIEATATTDPAVATPTATPGQ